LLIMRGGAGAFEWAAVSGTARVCGRHESGRRGRPWAGPVRWTQEVDSPSRRAAQWAAKSVDLWRYAQRPAAGLPAAAQAALRQARRSVPAVGQSQQPATTAAMPVPRRRDAPRSHRSCRAQARGFPTIAARTPEDRVGPPSRCRRTQRSHGTAPASPGARARCLGGGTSRRWSCRTRLGPRQPQTARRPAAGPAVGAITMAAGSGGRARHSCTGG